MVHKKLISFVTHKNNFSVQTICRIEEQQRWFSDCGAQIHRWLWPGEKHGVNPPWMSMNFFFFFWKYKGRHEFGVVVVIFISLKFRLDFFFIAIDRLDVFEWRACYTKFENHWCEGKLSRLHWYMGRCWLLMDVSHLQPPVFICAVTWFFVLT